MAAHAGREQRLQFAERAVAERRVGHLTGNRAKVRRERINRRLPLAAGEHRAARHAGLQRLHEPLDGLAHAKRKAGPMQRQIGGVEIAAFQMADGAPRAGPAGDRGIAAQPLQIARRAAQLKLDFPIQGDSVRRGRRRMGRRRLAHGNGARTAGCGEGTSMITET